MRERVLRIGTRGSRLALYQAERVRERLAVESEIVVVKTSGDRLREQPLGKQDTIGFFTKEIENELLAGRVDIAVHSLKDLPTTLVAGLELGALLERDAASDLLLLRPDAHLPRKDPPLVPGARVGGSAMRRQALLAKLAPGSVPAPIRGNVTTRIDKARRGDYEAIVLSRSGVQRLALDIEPLLAFDLNPARWICAPGQGIIAVETRVDDEYVNEQVAALDHRDTSDCARAERQLLFTFGGGCHTPFGAWARPDGDLFLISVAAPGRDGNFQTAHFGPGRLADVQRDADQWIRAGCPGQEDERQEQWISRPARPWY